LPPNAIASAATTSVCRSTNVLTCSVRNCGAPLPLAERVATCSEGHSFDRGKSGYWNLLQPQDSRARQPGDDRNAVAARRRLHDRGITEPFLDALIEMAQPTATMTVVDAGCGEGFYAGSIAERTGAAIVGIDISVHASDAAARRYPTCTWIVANADRQLPVADRACEIAMSITGRANASEFARVLRPQGIALIAVPSPEDLVELRGEGRERVTRTVADFANGFELVAQRRVTTVADAVALPDLATAIYMPRSDVPNKGVVAHVTLSLDILLLRKR
jgi:23S rRNA (guanine745-N1)-methyltransferase